MEDRSRDPRSHRRGRIAPAKAAADRTQARYIEAVADGMTVIGIYLPNGNSGGDAGFAYKLAWMDRLRERVATLLEQDTPLVVLGDFNVCPTDEDFAPGALSPADALVRPESRARSVP